MQWFVVLKTVSEMLKRLELVLMVHLIFTLSPLSKHLSRSGFLAR